MKKLMAVGALMAMTSLGAWADVASGWRLSQVTVIPRWPFDRTVDVQFVAKVADGAGAKRRAARLELRVNGSDVPESELKQTWILGEGHRRLVWTPAETGYPPEFKSAAISIAVVEDLKDVGYLTVDLASGRYAYKPMSFSNTVNSSTYKTTHMAFRHISATTSADWRNKTGKSTFRIGSDGTRTDLGITDGDRQREGTANITLTKDYFFGVFPMTSKQYALLGGSTQTQDSVPMRSLSYDGLRGTDGTNNVDNVDGYYCFPKSRTVKGNTPIGRLRSRSGLSFDFPTEAEWEYAARAGTEGEYFFDDTGLKEQGINDKLNLYGANSWNAAVGSKLPNAWGIYDLIGCCHQWTTTCCDDNKTKHADAADPLGMTTKYGSGPFRVCKGSHYNTGGGSTQRRVQRIAYRMLQRSNCMDGTLNGTKFTAEQGNSGCRLSLRLDD